MIIMKVYYVSILSFILFSINLIVIFRLVKTAKSGGGKAVYVPPIPENENASAIHKLSFSSPFVYHYSPWITRKLLLTLNSTSTHIQHFKLEQLQSLDVNKLLPLDYTCNKINKINLSKVNLRSFQETHLDTANLTCSELEFLHEQSLSQQMKSKTTFHNLNPLLNQEWLLCEELNENTIKEICKKVNNINARKIMAPLEASISKSKSYKQAYNKIHQSLKNILVNYKLKYCSKFSVLDVISKQNRDLMLNLILHKSNENTCGDVLTELVRMDALTNRFYCEFDQLLSRIYCQGYSVKETCDDCRMAYQQWLCSMVLPYHFQDILIKPCLSICQRVERTCPYLHPEIKDQYGGEPIFICNDHNIPFVENSTDVPYGKDHACYQRCHLDSNHTLILKTRKNENLIPNNSTEFTFEESDEQDLHENPELEYCVSHQTILRKLRHTKNKIDFENSFILKEEKKLIITNTQNKRDISSKVKNNYSIDRLTTNFEKEEYVKIISLNENESFNDETSLEETNENSNIQSKYINDNIFYLDNLNFSEPIINSFINNTNKQLNEEFNFKNENYKLHLKQPTMHQTSKYPEDDENDNEDGDSDTDQFISTTTSVSFNAIINKKTKDKKQV